MSNWVVPSWVVPHYGVLDLTSGGVIEDEEDEANFETADGYELYTSNNLQFNVQE